MLCLFLLGKQKHMAYISCCKMHYWEIFRYFSVKYNIAIYKDTTEMLVLSICPLATPCFPYKSLS